MSHRTRDQGFVTTSSRSSLADGVRAIQRADPAVRRSLARRAVAEAVGTGLLVAAVVGSGVLFLCTHNSARSQMAEAFLRHLAGDRFELASAGTEATRVHPLAIRAMQEVGIDISAQRSKTVDSLRDDPWDYVITVCDSTNERCPAVPGSHDAAPLELRGPLPGQRGRGRATRELPPRA